MYDYKAAVERIHAPEHLKGRVLAAAQASRRPRRYAPLFRAAVCAACALILVLGSVTLTRPASVPTDAPAPKGPAAVSIRYAFGLTACAADTGANGSVILRWEDGAGRFRITGEGVDTVSLSVRGGILQRDGADCGDQLTEPFDPDAVYALTGDAGEDLSALDGAELTLTARFTDGSEKTSAYRFSAETLRAFRNENGGEVLIPALEGDSLGDTPALYAVSSDSRFLLWPAAQSNTVSLSNDYGTRDTPNGSLFHSGIDIPGRQGTDITAAAAGTVTEAGFDAAHGNYLVLDHGGGLTTRYAHCQKVLVHTGDTVEAGAVIALLGSTGMSTGPHLHFEVRQGGQAQNPVAYFDSAIRDTLTAE